MIDSEYGSPESGRELQCLYQHRWAASLRWRAKARGARKRIHLYGKLSAYVAPLALAAYVKSDSAKPSHMSRSPGRNVRNQQRQPRMKSAARSRHAGIIRDGGESRHVDDLATIDIFVEDDERRHIQRIDAIDVAGIMIDCGCQRAYIDIIHDFWHKAISVIAHVNHARASCV